MADGGEVGKCSGPHQPDCQYFADGGEALPEGFTLDQAPAAAPQPAASDLPTGFQLEQAPSDLPDGFKLEEAPKVDDGPSLPTSFKDAAHRLATNGLFAIPPEEAPAGTPLTEEMMDKTRHAEEGAAMAGSLITGVGPVGAAMKAGEAVADLAGLGKIGSSIIKGMIGSGLIQGEDEVSKWLMGQGNPQDPVGAAMAHIGSAAVLGGGTFGLGAVANRGLGKLAESKAATKLSEFMAGIASAAQHPMGEREAVDTAVNALPGISGAYKAGQKAFDRGLTSLPKTAAKAIGAYVGEKFGGGYTGYKIGEALAAPLGNMVEKLVRPAARKFVVPVTLKIIASGNTQGLLEALGHAESVGMGFDAIGKGLEPLFSGAVRSGIKAAADSGGDKAKEKLDEYISNGGVSQNILQDLYRQNDIEPVVPMMAHGGEVKANTPAPSSGPGLHDGTAGVAMHYPEQSMMMAAAKGRISNYLSSLRPLPHSAKLAFDDEPDTREQKKSYHRALGIAVKPLSILKGIEGGTLEPEDVKHFNAMHPELQGLLQRKITEKITQAQLDGKKPPYHVRQGLSMFMGTALSGELTPQNIQAAQQVFAPRHQPEQPQQKSKGTSKRQGASLTKSDQSFLTDDQARQKRQNKT